MDIKSLYKLYSQNYLVDTDTRSSRKGSVFFALKGENFNGNKFAKNAIEKGASFAVIDEEKYQIKDKTFLVKNVLSTLQELATYHRRQLNCPIIALTGSNGKTTTKELINCVLSKKYITTATIGNLNNHIGVPLTILSMTPNTEFGIVEMGANHLNEISLLSKIAQPNFGYITNFGKAHLEGFGSVEGVIKGKSELYNFLKKSKGKVFINSNDIIQIQQSKGIEQIKFNQNIEFITANPFVYIKFDNLTIQSNLIGEYNFNNIAAAITIGNYFNIESSLIKEAIENYIPSDNRSQIIMKNSNKFILDAYNANPSSMAVALKNLSKLNDESKVVFLGDMFELGNQSKNEHQIIAKLAEDYNFNKLYLIGKAFSTIKVKNAFLYDSYESFQNSFSSKEITNSTILIKGSRGMALERILDLF